MVCMLGVFFSLSLEMQMLCASAFVPAKKLVLSFVHFSAWNVYRLGKTHGDLFILWRNVNLLKPVHRSTTENRFLFTLIFDRVRNESYARAQNVLTFDGFFGMSNESQTFASMVVLLWQPNSGALTIPIAPINFFPSPLRDVFLSSLLTATNNNNKKKNGGRKMSVQHLHNKEIVCAQVLREFS